MVTLLLIIIYIAFISLGLPDSILGAAWPLIRIDLSMPMAGAGLISMIISGGTIISSMLSGRLINKLGTAKIVIISVFMTAVALFGFSFGKNYFWLCIMGIPLGLGAGAIDTALNNFVALHYSARQMSWLHCFWGIGATTGPIIMSANIAKNGLWRNGYFTIATIQMCLVIVLFISFPLWKIFQNNGEEDTVVLDSTQSVFKIPGIGYALLSFFAYCAIETTTGLWGASYLVNTKGVSADVAAGWISIYFFGITIGRFANGFLTSKVSNNTLIRGGQIIIGLGALLLLVINNSYASLVGFILIGTGCAPIFPSMLHETPVRFGKNNSGRLMGLQMAFAYMGTTFVPPVLGLLFGVTGIQVYPIFVLLFLVIMFLSNEKITKLTL